MHISTHVYRFMHEYPQLNNGFMICYIPEDEEDGYYFGQEQVPLTDEIKEILEEYPDGQIFKVCVNIRIYLYTCTYVVGKI